MYCLQDEENRIYCDVFDKSYIDGKYHNFLKSQFDIKIFRKTNKPVVICKTYSQLINCRYR